MIGALPLRVRVAVAFSLTAALAMVGLGAFVYYRVAATLESQTAQLLRVQLDALTTVPAARRLEVAEGMSGEAFGQVLTTDASVEASSPQVNGALISSDQVPSEPGRRVSVEQGVWFADEDAPEVAALLLVREGDQVLVVGTSLEDVEDALAGVLSQLWIGGPLALALASCAGYAVAGSALRPVERMRRQAATISARSSGERLPLPLAHDEIYRLGQTLNGMLDRLDAALTRERRFVAEASHELRTPLAMLRMELDLALSRPRSREELLAALHSADEEAQRLTRLAEDLFLLTRSGEDELELEVSDVHVRALLESIAARFATRTKAQNRTVSVMSDVPLVVRADHDRLDRALSNLLDNALRHGAGNIELTARRRDGQVSISVADQGPGMDATFRSRAIDPFARHPGARSTPGHGLGLTIAAAIAAQHHGAITLDRPPGGPGTLATITLPG
jgi:signal transduction histidine kinase